MTKEKEINSLREDLRYYNQTYLSGFPRISDVEYDALVEKLRKLSPDDEFFEKAVAVKPESRMEKLPLPMYSLEKIKKLDKLRSWLKKMQDNGADTIIATPKFDGISLLVNEDIYTSWTRGNGEEGQNSTKHTRFMNIPKCSKGIEGLTFTWGEAIIKKQDFALLKNNKDFTQKNARNMVAGIFNSDEGYRNPYINRVKFIRYGSDLEMNKDAQLLTLRKYYGVENVASMSKLHITELLSLSDTELNEVIDILYSEFNNEYQIDGIVLELNEYFFRKKLGRLSNGNPAYAVAFKKDEWYDVYQTKVTGFEFGIGKNGRLNPVILVEPVEVSGGVTVSRVTGNNVSYLVNNRIHKGAVIEITRSGDVIPKHIKTLLSEYDGVEKLMDELQVCPCCGEPLQWDENYVNLVCTNKECSDRRISELVYFFRTLGCEGFEEPTIRRLWDKDETWHTIDGFISASVEQFQEILGEITGKKVFDQITNMCEDGIPYARFLTALNIFDGKIAEITCQKILDGAYLHLNEDGSVGMFREAEITKIPGIGEITAKCFMDGLTKLEKYLWVMRHVKIIYPEKREISKDALYVCFSGFRDKQLEEKLVNKGHVVVNGITKECNLLVVADKSKSSSKIQKAIEKGVKILTKEEFVNEVLL